MATAPVRLTPAPRPTETMEERFQRLAAAWHEAVAHHSSSRIRYGHPAYQEVIALGLPVIPFLLRDMQDHQRHWFSALAAITGADPIPELAAGNIPRMIDAWLEWGKEAGYRW